MKIQLDHESVIVRKLSYAKLHLEDAKTMNPIYALEKIGDAFWCLECAKEELAEWDEEESNP